MNTQELIKEIRKPGKIAIEMAATEMEILVDKSDFIRVVQANEIAEPEYSIVNRDGYRVVFFDGNW